MTQTKLPLPTISERLQFLADASESAAKFLEFGSGHAPKDLQDQLDALRNTDPHGIAFNNTLWQMSRVIFEIREIARSQEIDISFGIKCLNRALTGKLYEEDTNEGEGP